VLRYQWGQIRFLAFFAAKDTEGADPVTRLQLPTDFGLKDPAFAILDSLAQDRSERLLDWIIEDPALASLHADPRWAALLARMGLR
jgi:hypothetical protein